MLREFLYVDVTRVRSLIGQLDRGVVEAVVERSAHGVATDIFSAIGMSGLRKRENTAEVTQTRSVEDILFVAFEEVAEAQGLIRDIDPSDPNLWSSSSLHADLEEGEIVRLHADVLILDPQFVQDRFERFMAVTESLGGLQRAAVEGVISAKRDELEAVITAQLDGAPRDQRKNKERQLRKEMEKQLNLATEAALTEASGLNSDQIKPIADVLGSFFTADAITVRILPCGRSRPEYSFVGSLLGRDEYIQRERDALFSRYGSIISGWTSVLQVASVSSEADAIAARDQELAGIDLAPGGVIDRAGTERAALDLLSMMDSLGVSEGPRWPAVSVVPLGIYRTVPRSLDPPTPATAAPRPAE